jgi:putative transposase
MARIARVVIPDVPHHVVQRGNRSQKVFFSEQDKQAYLDILAEQSQEHNIRIVAYCLMDNHVHLVVIPRDENGLARGIGTTHKMYTRMVNFREGWRGYLWQGRFSSFPLNMNHLLAVIRYVERNPVRAGIVPQPCDYMWSSARYHVLGYPSNVLSAHDDIISPNDLRSFLSTPELEEQDRIFRKLSRTGRPLGDEHFVRQLEKLSGRLLRPQKAGRKKMSIMSPEKKV